MARTTFFDRSLSHIKNNRLVALLLLLGSTVIAAASFTDATHSLLSVWPQSKPAGIAGKWRTPVLASAYDKQQRFTLLFEFVADGDSFSGTVTEAGEDGAHVVTRVIKNGKRKDESISFFTEGLVTMGDANAAYKEYYFGTFDQARKEMSFKRLNDVVPGGGEPEYFAASRD